MPRPGKARSQRCNPRRPDQHSRSRGARRGQPRPPPSTVAQDRHPITGRMQPLRQPLGSREVRCVLRSWVNIGPPAPNGTPVVAGGSPGGHDDGEQIRRPRTPSQIRTSGTGAQPLRRRRRGTTTRRTEPCAGDDDPTMEEPDLRILQDSSCQQAASDSKPHPPAHVPWSEPALGVERPPGLSPLAEMAALSRESLPELPPLRSSVS